MEARCRHALRSLPSSPRSSTIISRSPVNPTRTDPGAGSELRRPNLGLDCSDEAKLTPSCGLVNRRWSSSTPSCGLVDRMEELVDSELRTGQPKRSPGGGVGRVLSACGGPRRPSITVGVSVCIPAITGRT